MSYSVHPEVAGDLGPDTELDTTVHPPVVKRLNYEFAGWSGSDLVEAFPSYIVTRRLADAISDADLTGVIFDDVTVTKDPQFERIFPEQANSLPEWRWLRPAGRPGEDDFWQDDSAVLHISDRAMEVLDKFNLAECEIKEVGRSEEPDE